MPKTLVIIPAYNEAARIAQVIGGLSALQPQWDILVVNDGSADNTAQAAKEAGAAVVGHPFNLGYGAALQTGYKYAARNGYQYAVQMDADGQHLPSEVQKLLDMVVEDRADVAIGSRFLSGGGGYQVPPLRKLGIDLFSGLANLLSGKKLTDVTSGFSAVNRKVIVLCASDLFPADFPDADVRLMMLKLGLRVMEVPAAMQSGPPDKSMHAGLGTIWYVIKMLISILVVWITSFTMPVDKEGSS